MQKSDLIKYLELSEQIKQLSEQLDALKSNIKTEFEGKAGLKSVDGIQYGIREQVRTGFDTSRMIQDLGSQLMSKYETLTPYVVTVVKLTSDSIKNVLYKENEK